MKAKPSILFTGDIANVSMSGYQRHDALLGLGYTVRLFDYGAFRPAETALSRVRRRLLGPQVNRDYDARLNESLLALRDQLQPDIVWMEWPRVVQRETLEQLRAAWPQATIACFQDDNPFGDRVEERAGWEMFIKNIPFFDIHFVKRPEDVVQFTKCGARRVALAMHGVYAPLFRPRLPGSSWMDLDVSFVGTALDHRVDHIGELLESYHMPVDVFGRKWYKTASRWRHFRRFHAPVSGQAYVDVSWRSAISLAFVSSRHHDEYTMRTFEIPGAGGFLLAERTPKHCELFEEGKEAEFFDSPAECADKARFYLKNPVLRTKIAAAGRLRCVYCDYSLDSRMKESLSMCTL